MVYMIWSAPTANTLELKADHTSKCLSLPGIVPKEQGYSIYKAVVLYLHSPAQHLHLH